MVKASKAAWDDRAFNVVSKIPVVGTVGSVVYAVEKAVRGDPYRAGKGAIGAFGGLVRDVSLVPTGGASYAPATAFMYVGEKALDKYGNPANKNKKAYK
eukprot:7681-Heterococcus_DN1.PRE.2